MDCSSPGSSVHGISQARILKWVAISFSRASLWPRGLIHISYIGRRFFTTEPPGKSHQKYTSHLKTSKKKKNQPKICRNLGSKVRNKRLVIYSIMLTGIYTISTHTIYNFIFFAITFYIVNVVTKDVDIVFTSLQAPILGMILSGWSWASCMLAISTLQDCWENSKQQWT